MKATAYSTGVAALVSVMFVGCGGSDAPPTAPISGVVMMQGQPVPNVNVTFYPKSGRPATGRTNAEGRFKLTTLKPGDGAVIGTHKIAVTNDASNDASSSPPMPGMPGYEAYMSSQKKGVASRFADPEKSGLTMVVEAPADDVTLEVTAGS